MKGQLAQIHCKTKLKVEKCSPLTKYSFYGNNFPKHFYLIYNNYACIQFENAYQMRGDHKNRTSISQNIDIFSFLLTYCPLKGYPDHPPYITGTFNLHISSGTALARVGDSFSVFLTSAVSAQQSLSSVSV